MFKRLMSAIRAFRFEWKHYSENTEWAQRFDLWKKEESAFKITHEVFHPLPNGERVRAPVNLKHRCTDSEGNVRFFNDVPDGCTLVDYSDNLLTVSSGHS